MDHQANSPEWNPGDGPGQDLNPMQLRRQCLWRGLRKRCPRCDQKGLHSGFAKLHEACLACGLVLRREQGAQTGAMYMTAAVCQVFSISLVWLAWLFTDWGAPTFMAVAAPIVLVFCACFLPISQTLWVAVEYMTDVTSGEAWVKPKD